MIELLEITFLAGAVVAYGTWAIVVLASKPLVDAGPHSVPLRGALARTLLFAPLWMPGLLLLAAHAPGLAGMLGVIEDHCLSHPLHHHLCVVHPPHASEQAWSWVLPMSCVLVVIPAVASCARRARREWSLAKTLVALSRPCALGEDVRILDEARPLALTVGWRRPIVVLSSGLVDGVSRDTLSVVLAHERAHVARADTRGALVERMLASVFPPSVRSRLLARMSLAREQACDSIAARGVGGPVLVARALLEVAGARVVTPEAGASIAAGDIQARIEHLLDARQPSSRRWVAGATVLATLLFVAAIWPVHHALERIIHYLVH